jgi:hypothetical protein
LLIVEGDLEITGQFEWHGMVVVKGKLNLAGGGNTTQLIEGSLFVGGDVGSTVVGGSRQAALGGKAAIQLSLERVNQLALRLGRYHLWMIVE